MSNRHESRFHIDQRVTVTELEPSATPQSARLANFSAKGAALIVSRELSPGAALRIECGKTLLFGTVVHCTCLGDEFELGVELEDALYSSTASCSRPQAAREPRRKAKLAGSTTR